MKHELTCLECGQLFVRKRLVGRGPKYCSRRCYSKSYDRHPDDTKDTPKNAICGRCRTPFVKKKRNQRYCTKACYYGAWIEQHPEVNNARQKKRRQEQPEWYREREPLYYKKYRTKIESSRPWSYLLQSRRVESEKRNWPFELTDEWACARWTGRCEITDLEFQKNAVRGPHPFSPTIDKIVPELGYTQANSRFVIWGVNALKGTGTDADMYFIAEAIVAAKDNPRS